MHKAIILLALYISLTSQLKIYIYSICNFGNIAQKLKDTGNKKLLRQTGINLSCQASCVSDVALKSCLHLFVATSLQYSALSDYFSCFAQQTLSRITF